MSATAFPIGFIVAHSSADAPRLLHKQVELVVSHNRFLHENKPENCSTCWSSCFSCTTSFFRSCIPKRPPSRTHQNNEHRCLLAANRQVRTTDRQNVLCEVPDITLRYNTPVHLIAISDDSSGCTLARDSAVVASYLICSMHIHIGGAHFTHPQTYNLKDTS